MEQTEGAFAQMAREMKSDALVTAQTQLLQMPCHVEEMGLDRTVEGGFGHRVAIRHHDPSIPRTREFGSRVLAGADEHSAQPHVPPDGFKVFKRGIGVAEIELNEIVAETLCLLPGSCQNNSSEVIISRHVGEVGQSAADWMRTLCAAVGRKGLHGCIRRVTHLPGELLQTLSGCGGQAGTV